MLAVASHGSGAITNFTGGVINSTNWDNGEPTGGDQGIINTNGNWDGTIDNYDIRHIGGTITPNGFKTSGWSLGTSVTFEVDGGIISSTRGMTLGSGSAFTLTSGTVNYTANGTADVRANSASLEITSGTFDLARNLLIYGNGSSFTITGGTATIGGEIRDNGFGTGNATIQFNGGTTTADSFNFPVAGESVTFGGSTAGSLELTVALGTVAPLDWLGGSLMELTIAGADQAFYEGLFTSGDLLFEGSNAGSFGDNFQVSGSTLSLAVIPEPSALALLAGGLLVGALRRQRS